MKRAAERPVTQLVFGACLLVAAAGATAAAPAGPALGLPALPAWASHSAAQAELGRKLFFDRRLSANGTMSCAMCHVPEEGFAANGSRTAVGMQGTSLRRNAPSLYNVVWQRLLFLDGRSRSLAEQVWMPMLHADEMGNPSVAQVLRRIRGLPDYRGAFEQAFAGHGPSRRTVGLAIAAFESTLVSGNSRFDRYWYGGERDSLSAPERAGLELFRGKAGCVACHTVGSREALFTDGRFHVTGAGLAAPAARLRIPLAPGLATEIDADAFAAFAEPQQPDLGRFEVTHRPRERYAFRTPSLRNVSRSAPYMHDGSLATLEEVVAFYDAGGGAMEAKSPLLRPLALTKQEQQALVAFLKALDGDNIEALAVAARKNLPVELGGGARGY